MWIGESAEGHQGRRGGARMSRWITQAESEKGRWHAWSMSLHEPPDWLLNEFSHAGRENLDAHHVSLYDSKTDASAIDELALLRSLGLGASSTLIEFGPGTGQLTIEAARICERVVAVDVSPPMLASLQAKAAAEGLANIEAVEAGFLTYHHRPASADFVYSRLALHHLPDFWKVHALQRISDMLKVGGVFRLWDVVYSFDPRQANDRLEAWCATGEAVPPFTPVEDGWGRWEVAEHVRDEHSTYSWLLEEMFRRTGFVIEQCELTDDTTAKYVLRKA
jgi:SAM-dependent methyltransferase